MKKQKRKLNLNKRTISNLESSEMSKHVGGGNTQNNTCVVAEKGRPFTKRCQGW